MKLGNFEKNNVYCGDSAVLLKQLPDESIDLVVTSPPYDNLRKYNGYTFDFEAIASELYRVTKQGGVVVWVVGDQTVDGSETLTSFKQALFFKEVCGFRVHDTMIYQRINMPQTHNRYEQHFEYMFVFSKGKPSCSNLIRVKTKNFGATNNHSLGKSASLNEKSSKMANDKRVNRVTKEYAIKGNVWFYDVGGGKSTNDDFSFGHPAIFPEALARDHILSWSNAGDLVLDCFAGSGTTLKMAHETGRNFLGFELSEEYCQIARRRIAGAKTPLPLML